LASDLLHIDGFAFERKARVASDDEQPSEPRERGGDLFNHPIRKILLLRIAAHVLERQYRDGRPVRHLGLALTVTNTCRGSLTRFAWRANLIGSNWLLNVLDAMSTKVHESDRQDLAHLIVRRAGNTHASRCCDGLKPRGNVHPVTEQVSGAYHHVPDVS